MTKRAGMRGARIIGTGRELPPRVVMNEELTKLMDTKDEYTTVIAAAVLVL
jgi:3-oxoacyl-[acyl-carrier-protein] synthase III